MSLDLTLTAKGINCYRQAWGHFNKQGVTEIMA